MRAKKVPPRCPSCGMKAKKVPPRCPSCGVKAEKVPPRCPSYGVKAKKVPLCLNAQRLRSRILLDLTILAHILPAAASVLKGLRRPAGISREAKLFSLIRLRSR